MSEKAQRNGKSGKRDTIRSRFRENHTDTFHDIVAGERGAETSKAK